MQNSNKMLLFSLQRNRTKFACKKIQSFLPVLKFCAVSLYMSIQLILLAKNFPFCQDKVRKIKTYGLHAVFCSVKN